MFNAVLFAGNEPDGAVIEQLAVESGEVSFQKTLYRYPQTFELAQVLNAASPDLIFLDLSESASALAVASQARAHSSKAAVIGFGGGWQAFRQHDLELAGITDLLMSPVTLKSFRESVERAIQKQQGGVQENLIAFLPSKAGSGATTIALNTAGYLAGAADKSRSKKVLLIDADLHSGVISILLDVKPRWSVLDALENAGELDYTSWSNYAVKVHDVDFLISDPTRKVQASWTGYHHLLDFAARRYDHILVDLPEVINDATVEIVRRAKSVFVVCTPELPSMALAPQRCQELESRGVPAEKITVVINRWHKGEITAAQAREIMNHPVILFRNDYGAVSRAARAYDFVKPGSKLGDSFGEFARKLAGEPETGGGPLSFLRFGS
ncbi:MAG TPA: hypothetical protein VL285_04175 [Bryobacteraceae bacterium]|jgi:MinD-like ATPase involved in chromosome partitioning or flagellar assembly|nr:hypothetical protein [Bryobacteraceae bacterium]